MYPSYVLLIMRGYIEAIFTALASASCTQSLHPSPKVDHSFLGLKVVGSQTCGH